MQGGKQLARPEDGQRLKGSVHALGEQGRENGVRVGELNELLIVITEAIQWEPEVERANVAPDDRG